MNIFVDAYNWVVAHPIQALGYLAMLQSAASIVANMTPTPKDDEAVGKVFKVVHALALNFFHLRGIEAPSDSAAETNKEV